MSRNFLKRYNEDGEENCDFISGFIMSTLNSYYKNCINRLTNVILLLYKMSKNYFFIYRKFSKMDTFNNNKFVTNFLTFLICFKKGIIIYEYFESLVPNFTAEEHNVIEILARNIPFGSYVNNMYNFIFFDKELVFQNPLNQEQQNLQPMMVFMNIIINKITNKITNSFKQEFPNVIINNIDSNIEITNEQINNFLFNFFRIFKYFCSNRRPDLPGRLYTPNMIETLNRIEEQNPMNKGLIDERINVIDNEIFLLIKDIII
jgi:hypothetical protein